jgi:glycosyltransferase involved in cell wall biosynthesis
VRLAVLSPLPPAPTGIADYTALILSLLDAHEIDLYHDQGQVDRSHLPPRSRVSPASAFLERHRERPYDLAVYQMGNGPAHRFLYEFLSRVPGLLVLHDLVLHHSRAAHFLESEAVRAWRRDPTSSAARAAAEPWLASYREELEYTYPGSGGRVFEAQLGTVGHLLPYAYPLVRLPVEASKAVAVHNDFMARAVRQEVPGTEVCRIPLPAVAQPVSRARVAAARGRLGLDPEDIVVATFGLLTPEKQIGTVARAVARATARDSRLRLLLAGPSPDEVRLQRLLEDVGIARRTVVTGRLPFEELAVHIEASDIVVQLRYPTARETSGALLRVLAQGRATVISDLAHQAEIPSDAVVRADVTDEETQVTEAVLRLAGDPAERGALGERAAAYVRRAHSLEKTRLAWEEVLERTRRRAPPRTGDWPAHWPRP